ITMQGGWKIHIRMGFIGMVLVAGQATAGTVSLEEIDGILNEFAPSTAFEWEASAPLASEIKDQGETPYCGLYAMASLLELWGKAGRPSSAFPAVDASYLAVGYNRMVSGGSGGTSPIWLQATTQIFGAV